MDQTLPPRLPAKLESAVQRVRTAARTAAEHAVDSLGLSALATTGVLQRDALLCAQYELNRKLAIFALTFNEALDLDVARQAGTLVPTERPAGTAAITPDSLVASWESLSLVDDHELELHISADRFALEISHACEWEIRELDAYMATLMGQDAADHGRNPVRAEVVGQAMIRAIESLSDRPEVRKVLSSEIGRSLAQTMRQTYADIVADLRRAGVRPVGLVVRGTGARGHSAHGALAGDPHDGAGAPSGPGSFESGHGVHLPGPAAGPLAGWRPPGHAQAHPGEFQRGHGLSDGGHLSPRQGWRGSTTGAGHSGAGANSGMDASMGRVDAPMMALIRRLVQDSAPDRADPGGGAGFQTGHPGAAAATQGDGPWMRPAPNLIMAYRDELRQQASGALDHMVIDVIASLFDQILSDAKVPPQMARQIARLQLPVLRAALGDNSFFSSRRHPVRRFINRIASLGTAVDDFDGDEGRALLARVASLVQAVVDGDFDQIELYEQQLKLLEDFITAQAQAALQATGAADQMLARKEAQLRVQQRFAMELEVALRDLPVPQYLRDFLSGIWSQAIANAAAEGGFDGALAQRLRAAGRELVMSVQPKGTPALRQQFLRQLPQLMKDLNTGLDRIHCPEQERHDFFAQLLPAHAESLKGQALSTLEHNLLARQVDGVLATPLPLAADLPPMTGSASAQTVAVLQSMASPAVFSPAEARSVGLLDEAAVDWQRELDIDLSAEPEITVADVELPGLPAPETVEPTRGKSLADHVQIGFAYLMQLRGDWQKVRLAHVSPGRSFFVFTHGAKQRETVSMTHRMLVRLCAAGRLRAMENAYLLERATARARRQLAELAPKKR